MKGKVAVLSLVLVVGAVAIYFGSRPTVEKGPRVVSPRRTGTGVITGFARTPEGLPVEGVVVCLDSTDLRRFPAVSHRRSGPPSPSFAEESDGRFVVKTDAGGAFRASELIDELTYRVAAWKEGFEVRPVDTLAAEDAKDGDHIDFVVRKSYGIALRVFDPNGVEVESAKVTTRLDAPGIPRYSYCADWPRGEPIEYTAGTVDIKAEVGKSLKGAAKVVLPPAAGEKVDVEIRLAEATIVLLTVGCSDPAQLGGVSILAFEGKVDEAKVREGTASALAAFEVSTDHPRAEFAAPSPGVYTFLAKRDTATLAFVTFDVLPGVNYHELTIPAESVDDFIVVRVFDPAGKRLRSEVFDCVSGARAREREKGVYWLSRSNPESVGLEPSEASIFCVDGGSLGVIVREYSPKDDGDRIVRFEASRSLKVKLERYLGTAAENRLDIAVRPMVDSSLWNRHAAAARLRHDARYCDIDPSGAWTFKGLQPGAYEIEVRGTAGSLKGVNVASATADVAADSSDCVIALPELTRLVVAVPSATADLQLVLDSGAPDEAQRLTPLAERDAEGRFVFDPIPVGVYNLSARRGDLSFRPLEVAVKGPATAVYELRPERD